MEKITLFVCKDSKCIKHILLIISKLWDGELYYENLDRLGHISGSKEIQI